MYVLIYNIFKYINITNAKNSTSKSFTDIGTVILMQGLKLEYSLSGENEKMRGPRLDWQCSAKS